MIFGERPSIWVPTQNQNLPDPGLPNNLIAPYWGKLGLDNVSRMYVLREGSAPNRRITIAWTEMMIEDPAFSFHGRGSFEVTLYESSGDIVVQYLDVDFTDPDPAFDAMAYSFGAGATVGVEGPEGRNAKLYSFVQPLIQNATALRFTRDTTTP